MSRSRPIKSLRTSVQTPAQFRRVLRVLAPRLGQASTECTALDEERSPTRYEHPQGSGDQSSKRHCLTSGPRNSTFDDSLKFTHSLAHRITPAVSRRSRNRRICFRADVSQILHNSALKEFDRPGGDVVHTAHDFNLACLNHLAKNLTALQDALHPANHILPRDRFNEVAV
jgi:hypothetical protein